jgi:hypothetical protein
MIFVKIWLSQRVLYNGPSKFAGLEVNGSI